MSWEFDVLYALQEIHNPILDQIMIVITTLGDSGILWIVLGLLFLIPKKFRKMGLQVLLSMLITYIIGNLILKNVIARPRPYTVEGHEYMLGNLLISQPSEYSFPSGHTMNGFAAAMAMFFNNKKIGFCALVLATLIAFSRMYHFVHYPTDILGGIAVGMMMAFLVNFMFKKIQARKNIKM